MTRLDQQTAELLTKICAMFCSNHAGERASAAAMADSLVRQRELTWQQVIRPSPPISGPPISSRSHPHGFNCDDLSIEELFHHALQAEDENRLNAWERNFLISIYERRSLSERQVNKLRDIVAKYLARRAA